MSVSLQRGTVSPVLLLLLLCLLRLLLLCLPWHLAPWMSFPPLPLPQQLQRQRWKGAALLLCLRRHRSCRCTLLRLLCCQLAAPFLSRFRQCPHVLLQHMPLPLLMQRMWERSHQGLALPLLWEDCSQLQSPSSSSFHHCGSLLHSRHRLNNSSSSWLPLNNSSSSSRSWQLNWSASAASWLPGRSSCVRGRSNSSGERLSSAAQGAA